MQREFFDGEVQDEGYGEVPTLVPALAPAVEQDIQPRALQFEPHATVASDAILQADVHVTAAAPAVAVDSSCAVQGEAEAVATVPAAAIAAVAAPVVPAAASVPFAAATPAPSFAASGSVLLRMRRLRRQADSAAALLDALLDLSEEAIRILTWADVEKSQRFVRACLLVLLLTCLLPVRVLLLAIGVWKWSAPLLKLQRRINHMRAHKKQLHLVHSMRKHYGSKALRRPSQLHALAPPMRVVSPASVASSTSKQ
jgi:hypothetical protein